MSDTPTVFEVIDKLQALGSPRQIADFLAGEGVVGQRRASGGCPLANYVRREAHERVSVSHVSVDIGWPVTAHLEIVGTCLRGFVKEFDAGRYPELEADVIA